MPLGNATINIQVNIANIRQLNILKQNMQNTKKAADNAGASLLKLSNQMRNLSSVLRDVGRNFAIVTGAIAAGFLAIAVESGRFEQAVANVGSVIDGIGNSVTGSQARLNSLRDTILELGKTTEFTGVQVAEGARKLALAGFSDREIKDSLESVVSLASATNTELEKTAEIAARITRAFGKAADQFRDVADILASVAANSNTTLEGLGESFKLASPIAKVLGQDLKDLAVVFGVLGNAGIQNSRAGTGISRFLSELTEKREDIEEFLAPLGRSFSEIDPTKVAIQDIIAVFEELQVAGDIEGRDIFAIFDQRSARTFASAVNSGTAALKSLDDQIKSGFAATVRKFRIDTLAGDFLKLKSAISALAVTIGQAVGPAFRFLVTILTNVVKWLEDTANAWPSVVQGISAFIAAVALMAGSLAILATATAAIAGFVAALLALSATIVNFGAIAAVFTGFFGAMSAATAFLGISLSALILPLTVLVGLTAAVAYGISTLFKSTNQLDSDLFVANRTLEETSAVLAELRDVIQKISDFGTLQPLEITKLIDSGGIKNAVGEAADAVRLLDAQFRSLREKRDSQFFPAQELRDAVQDLLKAKLEAQKVLNDALEVKQDFSTPALTVLADANKRLSLLKKEVKKAISELRDVNVSDANKATLRDQEIPILQQKIDLEEKRRDAANKRLKEDFRIADARNAVDPLGELLKIKEVLAVENRIRQEASAVDLADIKARTEAISDFAKDRKDINDAASKDIDALSAKIDNLKGTTARDSDGNLVTTLGQIEKIRERIARFNTEEVFAAESKVLAEQELRDILNDSDSSDFQKKQARDKVAQANQEILDLPEKLANLRKAEIAQREALAEAEELRQQNLIQREMKLADLEAQRDRARLRVMAELKLSLAESNDNISEVIAQTEKLGQLDIAEKLVDFRKEGTLNAEELKDVEKLLNKELQSQLDSLLDIKGVTEEIVEFERQRLLASQNSSEQVKTKAGFNADDELKNVEDLEKRAQASVDRLLGKGNLTADEQASLKKQQAFLAVKAKAARRQAIQDKKDKKVREQKSKDDKDLRDIQFDLEKSEAERAENIAKLVDLERERLELKDKELLLDKNISDVEKANIETRQAAERDAKLKAFEEKLLADQKKRREAADAKAKKAGKISKDVNGFAKARANLESKIADRLVNQVRSIREAKNLLVFINRLQRGNAKRALNLGNQTAAQTKRVNSLKEALAAAQKGGDQKEINRITGQLVREEIKLSVLVGQANNAFQAVGASAGALAQSLAKLNGIVQQSANPVNANPNIPVTPLGRNPKLPAPTPSTNVKIGDVILNGISSLTSPEDLGELIVDTITDLFKKGS